jgi:hypothetical protein
MYNRMSKAFRGRGFLFPSCAVLFPLYSGAAIPLPLAFDFGPRLRGWRGRITKGDHRLFSPSRRASGSTRDRPYYSPVRWRLRTGTQATSAVEPACFRQGHSILLRLPLGFGLPVLDAPLDTGPAGVYTCPQYGGKKATSEYCAVQRRAAVDSAGAVRAPPSGVLLPRASERGRHGTGCAAARAGSLGRCGDTGQDSLRSPHVLRGEPG